MRVGGGDDLDPIAVGQFGHQRQHFEIDLRGNTVVPDIRVHRIRQVNRRGAAWQGDDLAFGRKHVDLVRKEIDLDVLEKLRSISGRALQVEQRVKPGGRFLLQIGTEVLAILVQPVRGNTFLRHVLHRFSANLHLERGAMRTNQRGVQGLVAIGLGNGNIVLELSRHRLEQPVQRTEGEVGGGHIAYQHAETVDVEHLRE
ncbi:MAG: hypothetical protein AW09_004217 [Candidatus Accumulibacter phosphatis]|uniref:Uncharacterized protein n=1 Tax=Candidatus Accumulibacter phosphatis TaxID=327160 RepID=A0A080LSX9_9PROT|nr:MAG: hypothetical protein AW09_004217 [Candidatus Accumulibacter phosphatis]